MSERRAGVVDTGKHAGAARRRPPSAAMLAALRLLDGHGAAWCEPYHRRHNPNPRWITAAVDTISAVTMRALVDRGYAEHFGVTNLSPRPKARITARGREVLKHDGV